MENIIRTIALTLCALSATASVSQAPKEKPQIHVTMLPSEDVPVGSCKLDEPLGEAGYLENSDGKNNVTPYTPDQVGEYLASALKRGLVVTLYPQPDGKIFVVATCGMQKD
jgi:hypothetical protein